jgi:hypothetical protein
VARERILSEPIGPVVTGSLAAAHASAGQLRAISQPSSSVQVGVGSTSQRVRVGCILASAQAAAGVRPRGPRTLAPIVRCQWLCAPTVRAACRCRSSATCSAALEFVESTASKPAAFYVLGFYTRLQPVRPFSWTVADSDAVCWHWHRWPWICSCSCLVAGPAAAAAGTGSRPLSGAGRSGIASWDRIPIIGGGPNGVCI